MRWRKVIETAAGAAAAVHLWPHNTLPQTGPGQPQIGVLCPTTCVGPALDAFRSALGQQGLREGQTVTLIYREAEGQLHRLPSLAGELAGRKVDVLFSSWGTAAPLALKQASATIPIVAGAVGDPVAAGLVESLARPRGNVTGFSTMALALEGKRLELLREIEPKIARIAVLWDPNSALRSTWSKSNGQMTSPQPSTSRRAAAPRL